MRHPLILRPTLALAAALLACSAPAALADPSPHIVQDHLPGSHANVHNYAYVPKPAREAPAPAGDDFDAAAAGIAGGAAFVLGAGLSSLLVIRRTRPPAAT